MAKELRLGNPSGLTLYAVLVNAAGQYWNALSAAFEAYNASNWTATKYALALTETGAGDYFADFPSGIAAAGQYTAFFYKQLGGSPATTDTLLAQGSLAWDGSAEVSTATVTGRIPAALVSGRMDSSVGAVANNAITAAAIATDAIDADALAADAVTEMQSGLSTLNAAGVRSAVGLASANLDTQLSTIAGYVDTEVAQLITDVGTLLTRLSAARAGYLDNLSAGAVAQQATLSTVAGYVDTEVAQLLSDTASLLSRLSATRAGYLDNLSGGAVALQSLLTTVAGYVDTEVAAIKAKTDALPASPAATGDIPSASSVANAVLDATASSHNTSGTIGAKINSAAAAGDPWATSLPGSYTSGQAGYIVGNRLDAAVSSIGGAVGAGSTAYTVTVTEPNGTTPIEGVACWVSTDADGDDVIAGVLNTDALGNAAFMLDAGGPYYLWRQKGGWEFQNPTSFTVS